MADREDEFMADTVKTDDLAVTNQRVNQLERGVRDLSDDLQRQGKDLTTQISGVASTLAAKMEGLVGQLNERNKIQWPALSVGLAFIVALGGLVYWPIKDNQTRFENHLLAIAEKSVTQKELDQRFTTTAARRDDWQRASEDRSAANRKSIEELRESVVPRWMHDEKWRIGDQRYAQLLEAVAELRKGVVPRAELDEKWRSEDLKMTDLQRQIDKQDKAFGDTYSLRDVISRLTREQDELREQLRRVDRAADRPR